MWVQRAHDNQRPFPTTLASCSAKLERSECVAKQPILAPRSYGRSFALGLLCIGIRGPHHVSSPLALIRLYIEPPSPTPIQ